MQQLRVVNIRQLVDRLDLQNQLSADNEVEVVIA